MAKSRTVLAGPFCRDLHGPVVSLPLMARARVGLADDGLRVVVLTVGRTLAATWIGLRGGRAPSAGIDFRRRGYTRTCVRQDLSCLFRGMPWDILSRNRPEVARLAM